MPAIPYDEPLANAIVDAISVSSRSLGKVIEDLNADISPSLFYKWLQQNSLLRERYARARSEQAAVMAEQIGELVDKAPEMCEIPTKAGSYLSVDRGYLEWRRQQVEARKWLASKLLPKVYGDKLQHTGEGGGAIQIVSTIPRPQMAPGMLELTQGEDEGHAGV